jgi:alginate O-acetyltransferase complex protein AlgI
MTLETLILIGGLIHFAILIASVQVPRIFNWNEELARLSPFLRKLFWVYGVFIVLTIIGFGTISVVAAEALAGGSVLARITTGFMASWWFVRLIVQWFVFDTDAFSHNRLWLIGYHGLGLLILALTAIYAYAAIAGGAA